MVRGLTQAVLSTEKIGEAVVGEMQLCEKEPHTAFIPRQCVHIVFWSRVDKTEGDAHQTLSFKL